MCPSRPSWRACQSVAGPAQASLGATLSSHVRGPPQAICVTAAMDGGHECSIHTHTQHTHTHTQHVHTHTHTHTHTHVHTCTHTEQPFLPSFQSFPLLAGLLASDLLSGQRQWPELWQQSNAEHTWYLTNGDARGKEEGHPWHGYIR